METDYQVSCPYCWEQIWMEFFPEEGAQQEIVVDCEVCCNPILYRVSFQGDDPDGARARVRVEKAQ